MEQKETVFKGHAERMHDWCVGLPRAHATGSVVATAILTGKDESVRPSRHLTSLRKAASRSLGQHVAAMSTGTRGLGRRLGCTRSQPSVSLGHAHEDQRSGRCDRRASSKDGRLWRAEGLD